MKIAIIGATGFVGSRLVEEALNRGHEVTAIARHPEKLAVTHPRLSVKALDVVDKDALAKALGGHDIVISSFNAGWTNPDLYEDFLRGSEAIQEAAKAARVPRLFVIGGAGSLEVAPGVQLVDTPEFPAQWKNGALAARDYLNNLRKETALNWTFLSPAIELLPGDRTGSYRVGFDEPVFNDAHRSTISVNDLALAVIDEAENGKFLKKRFTVGY